MVIKMSLSEVGMSSQGIPVFLGGFRPQVCWDGQDALLVILWELVGMQGCLYPEPSNSLLEGLSQTLPGMGKAQLPWEFHSQE